MVESVEFIQSLYNLLVQGKVKTVASTVAEMQQRYNSKHTLHYTAATAPVSLTASLVVLSVRTYVISIYPLLLYTGAKGSDE